MMSHQGLMGRETRIPATPVDLHSMVAARKSPGILILNEFGDVLHLNDMAWEALSLLREQGPLSKDGLMPEAIMELRHELHSRARSLRAELSGALLEVTRLVATSHAGVLVRVMALEGPKAGPDHEPRNLVMLEIVAERAQVNGGGKERFGLTEREWEVTQSLLQGLTNKEIGNALGITEPTVKAHIKHIMGKMKCTTRTAIVSHVAGSMALRYC
jgi:DNA-binding NarL/FixJ family response regulator